MQPDTCAEPPLPPAEQVSAAEHSAPPQSDRDSSLLLPAIPEGTPTASEASPQQAPAQAGQQPSEQQQQPPAQTSCIPWQAATPPDKAPPPGATQPSPSGSVKSLTPEAPSAERPRRLRDWMSPRRRASEPGDGPSKRASTASPKLLFSRIKDKFVRRRSSRKSEADEAQDPLPPLPASSPGSLSAAPIFRAELSPDRQGPGACSPPAEPDDALFSAAPALVGTLPDSPPLPALPPSEGTQPEQQPALARAGTPVTSLLPPSPDIRSHALQLSEASASLQDESPSPGPHERLSDDADTASSLQPLQAPASPLPDPETSVSIRRPDVWAHPLSDGPGASEGGLSTPEGQFSAALTPYYTAQSCWEGSRELHTVPSGLFTPRPPGLDAGSYSAGQPMRTSLPMSENPLYGQHSSGPPSARGVKQLSGPAGLLQLSHAHANGAGPTLATQASIRAADASARQLERTRSSESEQLAPSSVPDSQIGWAQGKEPAFLAGPEPELEPEATDGSLTARGRALQRLKTRNIGRAYQSGALSARCGHSLLRHVQQHA